MWSAIGPRSRQPLPTCMIEKNVLHQRNNRVRLMSKFVISSSSPVFQSRSVFCPSLSNSPNVCQRRCFAIGQGFDEFRPDPGHWRSDPQFQQHKTKRKWQKLKGKAGREKLLFYSPFEQPVAFVTSWASVLFLIYSVFSLGSGETIGQRKRRMVQDRLYSENGLTENDLDEIEGMEDAPLSDDDAEQYASVMDPLLEPQEDRATAWALRPYFEEAQPFMESNRLTSNYPAVIALQQLQQVRRFKAYYYTLSLRSFQ